MNSARARDPHPRYVFLVGKMNVGESTIVLPFDSHEAFPRDRDIRLSLVEFETCREEGHEHFPNPEPVYFPTPDVAYAPVVMQMRPAPLPIIRRRRTDYYVPGFTSKLVPTGGRVVSASKKVKRKRILRKKIAAAQAKKPRRSWSPSDMLLGSDEEYVTEEEEEEVGEEEVQQQQQQQAGLYAEFDVSGGDAEPATPEDVIDRFLRERSEMASSPIQTSWDDQRGQEEQIQGCSSLLPLAGGGGGGAGECAQENKRNHGTAFDPVRQPLVPQLHQQAEMPYIPTDPPPGEEQSEGFGAFCLFSIRVLHPRLRYPLMHNLTKTLGYMCLEPPQGEPPLRLGIGCIELRVLPPAPKVNLVRESWIAKDIHIPLCILLQLLAVPLLADSLWDVVQSNGKVEYLLIQVASSGHLVEVSVGCWLKVDVRSNHFLCSCTEE